MAKVVCSKIPVLKIILNLNEIYGKKFLVLLACAYIGCKGALDSFVQRSTFAYYRELGLDVITYQTGATIASIPWAIKGCIGALSDGIPLFGYHKNPYIIITSVLGISAIFALLLTPHSFTVSNLIIIPCFYFLANWQNSTTDLLCEGKYSEVMRENPKVGTDIVSYVWLCIMIGKLVATSCFGPITDHFGTYYIFIICVPLSIQILIPIFLGYLNEKRLEKGSYFLPGKTLLKNKRHYFIISIAISAGAIGLALVGLLSTPQAQFIYSIVISFILCGLSFYLLPKTIACCNIYMFVEEMLHPSIGGALDFWFLAEENCVAGGPNFSYTYYSTWSGLVGTIASLIGVYCFHKFISKWTFRRAFWITSTIRIVAGIFDLIIVMRWNHKVGIPDKVIFMLGDAIILDIVSMLNFMPGVVMIARLCPPGIECTVYAILASFSNFGMTAARSLGNYATQVAGISAVVPCDFNSLPLLIIICHFGLPLLSIPLAFVLIPDVKMNNSFQIFDTVTNVEIESTKSNNLESRTKANSTTVIESTATLGSSTTIESTAIT